MTIQEIVFLLDARTLCGDENSPETYTTAFSSDMMSDALAFGREQSLLLTGLLNQQAIRTAEMLDMHCVIFVRGKVPSEDILRLAEEKGITVLTTTHGLFTASGLLYEAGLHGGM